MPLSIGTRLGPYKILSAIGAGGMGEVYKARDPRLDRIVAIKILAPEMAADSGLRARFEREARAVAALDDPHICGIYDVGSADGTHYLVMPYIDGQTLSARLAKGRLPLDEALRIAAEIAGALDKAHRQGILHRDLKPANVMLTKTGSKLLDFGLAKLRPPVGSIQMSGLTRLPTHATETAAGMILGTVQYMAPEQVEGQEADAPSDIWALGAVTYKMVTGTRAFAGDTPASVIGSILKDTVPPVSSQQPLAPVALDHVVARCLERDPDARWQNAGDVKRELQWIASGPVGAAAPAATSRRTIVGSFTWLVAGVGLGAALIGAGWSWRGVAPAATPRMTLAVAPPEQVRITGATALSPDGRSFVFVGQGSDGAPALWVRTIQNGAARQLADTDDPAFPFWSPQGDAVGFFAGGKLKTIALAGGPPKVLAAASSGRGGSWGPDGTILYVPETTSPIFRISDRGGESTAVTKLDAVGGQIGHRWPHYIDSGHFLFTVQGARPDATGIYFSSVGSTGTSRLVPQYSNGIYSNGHLLYVAESVIVARSLDPVRGTVGDPVELAGPVAYTGGLGFSAFSATATLLAFPSGTATAPTSLPQWFDRGGKLLGRLGQSSDLASYNAYYPAVSPDGRKVAIAAFQSATADLWLVDMDRDVSSRFTFNDATELSPVWSPDSNELLYASQRTGFYNIYRQSVSGRDEQQHVSSPSHQYPTDWSNDGRTIVFTNVDARTQADIWTMPAAGGSPTPFLNTSFNEYAARLSSDSQWLAYTSDESGRAEVYVQRFPSGRDKSQLSTQGGSHPQWRADRRELFYLGANRTVNAVAVTLAPSFSAARPARLFDVLVDTSIGSMHATHFAVSPDGQRFLLTVSAISPTSTTVVLNWQEELKRVPIR